MQTRSQNRRLAVSCGKVNPHLRSSCRSKAPGSGNVRARKKNLSRDHENEPFDSDTNKTVSNDNSVASIIAKDVSNENSQERLGSFIDLRPFSGICKNLNEEQHCLINSIDGQIGKMHMLMSRLQGQISSTALRCHSSSFDRNIEASEEIIAKLVSAKISDPLNQFLIDSIVETQVMMSETLSSASKSLDSVDAPEKPAVTNEDDTQATLHHMQYHAQLISQVPVFSGNILEFDHFITLFDRCANNLKYLPVEQKWEALRAKLVGPPLALVSGCSGSRSDYEQAYSALRREYTSPFRKSMALLAQRDKFPKLLQDSPKSLEEFYFKVSSWVSAVQELPTEDLSGFLLFETIFSKLPKNMSDTFCSSSLQGGLIPSAKDLLSFLSAKVESIRNVSSVHTTVQMQPSVKHGIRGSFLPRSPRRQESPPKYKAFSVTNLESEDQSNLDETHSFISTKEANFPRASNRPFRPGRPSRPIGCFLCKRDHFLYRCPEWLNLTLNARVLLTDAYRLCTRCLSNRHTEGSCPSDRTCIHCRDTHHTTLHPEQYSREDEERDVTCIPDRPTDYRSSRKWNRSRSPSPSAGTVHTLSLPTASNHAELDTPFSVEGKTTSSYELANTDQLSHSSQRKEPDEYFRRPPIVQYSGVTSGSRRPHEVQNNGIQQPVIPTAMVQVGNNGTNGCKIRALLDTGSETSLITLKAAKECGLQLAPFRGKVSGIGGATLSTILGITTAFVKLLDGGTLPVTFRILNKVTADLPSKDLPHDRWPHLFKNCLADPFFYKSGPVDAILGADIFVKVLKDRTIDSVRGSPTLQYTRLGWVVVGSFSYGVSRTVHFEKLDCEHRPRIRYTNRFSIIPADVQENSSVLIGPNATIIDEKETDDDWVEDNSGFWELPKSQRSVISKCDRNCLTKSAEGQAIFSPLSNSDVIPFNQGQIWEKYFQEHASVHNTTTSYPSSISRVSCVTGCFDICPSLIELPYTIDTSSNASFQALAARVDPNREIQDLLTRMFQLESVQEYSPRTPDELKAEELFATQSSRLPTGRFCVPLLLKRPASELGDSRRIALRRLFQLENRFKKNKTLESQYIEFMQDYLTSGHMSPVSPPSPNQNVYYLPHHAVFRHDSTTSKIRVVFNASQRTTTGSSLNDILHTGPKLLADIADIVTKFRQHPFVFTADIKQMFRNIDIAPQERDLLRIVWRPSSELPIQDYCLNTVTYGTVSAPYLANKVIKTLAESDRDKYPLASEILSNRTYVDDCHGGGPSIDIALQARHEIVSLLLSGGFELRKWAANHPALLSDLPIDHLLPNQNSVEFSTDEEKSLKVLGLLWNPSTDTFHYACSPVDLIRTKRDLASQVGRIFDPLGWLMPVAVQARTIQRSVCLARYGWDENLSADILSQWRLLAQDFEQLQHLSIPRLMVFSEDRDWLVGFADASERAYAAVIYHVNTSTSPSTIRLVLARARMAPIKVESLPRLELLAAELLSKVFSKVAPLFPHVPIERQLGCSDSTITLSWITADPAPLWKVFVGNRVAKTLAGLPADRWFHVCSSDNPADLASRGALPTQISQSSFWWSGPSWLNSQPSEWPCKRVRADLDDPQVASERRAKCPVLCTAVTRADCFTLEERFSKWVTLRRTVGWILRFTNNCQRTTERLRGTLTAGELQKAEILLIRRTQGRNFGDLLSDVRSGKGRHRLTKTLGLFIDSEGILRVGGRLSNSDLPFYTRHPALLPSDAHLTKIIISFAHELLLHVGPRSTLAWLRQKYWVVNGRNVVQRQLANCIRCFSVKPRPFQPEMGQLPAERTQSIAPFLNVGIDYAGPFDVNFTGHRGTRTHHMYLAIFVCFSTKAIHIEPVMDLSTDGFLQALERFVGRRGVPSVIWTDNGRNFLGAANLLRPLRQCLDTEAHRTTLVDRTSARGIQWKFIPPRAPHFGGLWEAAVKSTKRLLRITLRGQTPSFQVFSTLIVRVEAILNSRPLAADLSSPNELRVITPGHFLAQRPLTALPELSNEGRHSYLSAWRFVKQSTATFWKRWQREYLLEQQQMMKWNTPSKPPYVGQIVLIQDDNSPPLQWPIGVITTLHPGQDHKTRVAVVRTANGSKTRPLVRLCPLPDDSLGVAIAGEDVQSSH